MKTLALIKIRNDYGLSFGYKVPKELSKKINKIDIEFLKIIKRELESKGIACSCIKIEGNICYGINFQFQGHSIGIVWYILRWLSSNDKLVTVVECRNYYPRWKRIFKKYSKKELYTGQSLEQFISIMQEVFEKNQKIFGIKWISVSQMRDFFYRIKGFQLKRDNPGMYSNVAE